VALTAGTRLGPYEITAQIGVGGMGEVWSATDTNLGRQVAIKILPDAFAHDPDRLARFEREAKTLASLNHPNIAIIYGLEKADGIRALVMELVEGPTLADRIGQGPIPIDEALPIAKQIAEALEAAHEQGIIHRDLKPANIKLREDGTVKVLDFGLAKAMEPAGVISPSQTMSPTITAPAMTQMGIILGTASYMSPEQARGQSVDKRTDIWAFGCVLYEMVTRRAAFGGDTVSETLARVLEREPEWARVPAATPPGVHRLLRRCLEKISKRRLRDIGDARLELQEAIDGAPDLASMSQSGRPGTRLRWIAATTLVLGFLGGMAWQSITRPAALLPQDVVRFTVPLSPGELFAVDGAYPPSLAISADGRQIAYLARGPDGDRVFLRRGSESAAVPLDGTEGAVGPFFSPDGQWIGFASGGILRKVPVAGGAPQHIARAPNLAGAIWLTDDTIVYSPEWRDALFVVSAHGGEPRRLTTLNRQANEIEHIAPHVLPDGTHLLTTVGTAMSLGQGVTSQHIEVVNLVTGQRRRLVEGRNPFYVATAHLVFARGDTLFAAPFDSRRLELTGPPVRILEGVQSSGNDTQFALNRDGTLVYIPSASVSDDRALVRVDRGGRRRAFSDYRGLLSHPRISPDGKYVVVQERRNFWIYDVSRGTRTRLRAQGSRPIWMPEGRSILFNDQGQLYAAPIDDSAEPQLVLAPERGLAFSLAWSRDGRALLYSNPVPGADRSRDVWILPTGGKPTPFLTTSKDERAAMFSPDGRWVVYAEKEVGREEEVYVQPYPGAGGRVIVSQGGGIEPVWSPTGREIFYRSVDGRRMIAVDVHTQPSFSVGTPRVLFEGAYPLAASYWSDYDVFRGGKEFLMVAADDAAPSELHVVINWITEMAQRLAARQ
jgi:Tol biopolymer transport system component